MEVCSRKHLFAYMLVYITFYNALLLHAAEKPSDSCIEQINNCACKTDKGYINLDPLDAAKTGGSPKFSGISDTDGNKYSYNPCTAFDDGYSCKSVAVCKTDTYSYQYSLGLQTGASFTSSADGSKLVYKDSSSSYTSNVLLKCDSKVEGTLTVKPVSYNEYDFTLTTKYACSDIAPPPPGYSRPGSLSPGDVMLIIFFVTLAVYFISGILFNKFYKQNSGQDLIPNVEFWKTLPGLAKDGVLFTWGKITGLVSGASGDSKRSTYESI